MRQKGHVLCDCLDQEETVKRILVSIRFGRKTAG